MKTKALSIASAVMLIAFAAFAATGTSRRGTRRPPAEKEAAQCGTVNPVVDYANRVRVDSPERHGNLSLFAISVVGAKVPHVDLTLDQAVKQGLVEVTELDESEVNRVRIRTRAKEPVFVMAGEMLRGGKQDRIAGDDLILPPKSDLTISVFCVEHGRWAGRGSGFSTGHSLAGARVRGAAAGGGRGGGQGAVWSGVAEQQRALRAPSATGALRSVHDSEAVREKMNPYLRALTDLSDNHPKAIGVVAVVGDEILAADLYSSRKLFEAMWPDLLEAYVIDALEHEDPVPVSGGHREKRTALHEKDILRWLNGLRSVRMSPKDTPDDGDLFDLTGRELRGAAPLDDRPLSHHDAVLLIGDLSGTALLFDCGVVHIALFPYTVIAEPDFNSLQFRRERLR
jgi:hypothetical protein